MNCPSRKGCAPYLLLASLLAPQAPLAALSTATGPYGAGASAMGASGAVVATAQGPDALLWNPAGLVHGTLNLGVFTGSGGPAGSIQNDLTLCGPLDEGVGGGAFVEEQDLPGAQERTLGLGLAARLGSVVAAGVVERFITASPGSLQGWSTDAGLQAALPLPSGWALHCGLDGSALASNLAWQGGLVEQQPMILRAGLAVSTPNGAWLSVQQDTLEIMGLNGPGQWRLGLAWPRARPGLDLQLGATQLGQGAVGVSAGCAWHFNALGQDWAFEASWLIPTDNSVWAAGRPAVGIQWLPRRATAPTPPPIAPLERRLRLTPGPAEVQAWAVDLLDRRGRTRRTLHGLGPVPLETTWDGLDGQGDTMAADGLEYTLRATLALGKQVRHPALLAVFSPSAPDTAPIGLGSQLPALRPEEVSVVTHRRPSLLGLPGTDAFSARAALGDIAGGDQASQWELYVLKQAGPPVRRYSGLGHLPSSLSWDGKDGSGSPVAAGADIDFEIRLAGVKEPAWQADAVDADQAPAPSSTCGPDPAGPGLHGTINFEPGSSELNSPAFESILCAMDWACARGPVIVTIDGYASIGTPGQTPAWLAQQRSDRVLTMLVESGANIRELQAVGWGDCPGAADDQPHPDRVELHIRQAALPPE